MCFIVIKKPKNPIPHTDLDVAQLKNEHGYGVSWFDGEIKTFRTEDYQEFKDFLDTIEGFELIIHLRNNTAGGTNIDNVHPFEVPSGVMFHNGTFHMLAYKDSQESDTAKFARILSSTKYDKIEDIGTLVKMAAGTTLNRLVFMDKDDGKISVVNSKLGIMQDSGDWYSNDYYVPKVPTFVFVYGTLKEGLANHHWMHGAKFIDDATTAKKWAMIDGGFGFPYLLRENEEGFNVKGEVYEVDDDILTTLDILEGTPTHYVCVPLEVNIAGGTKTVYTYQKTTVTIHDLDEPLLEEFTGGT